MSETGSTPAETGEAGDEARTTAGTRRVWLVYLATAAITAAMLGARVGLEGWFGARPGLVFFFLPVLAASYAGGLGPGLLATVIAALGTDYLLFPPEHTFQFDRALDFAQWTVFLLAGVIVSLAGESARRARAARGSRRTPADPTRAERNVRVGFIAALALLLTVAAVSYSGVNRLSGQAAEFRRGQRVIDELRGLLEATINAETGERGYLVTGEKTFLEPLAAAQRSLPERFERLRGLVDDQPEWRGEIAALEVLARDRLRNAEEIVAQDRDGGATVARTMTASREGKRLQDEIRRRVDALEQTIQHRSDEREAAAAAAVIVVGGVLAVTVVAAALFLSGQDFARSRRAEAALREAQQSLERRVAERTAALAAAKTALEESEARLRLFVEHAPAALAMFDREMRYLVASDRWRRDYGLDGQTLPGRSHYAVLPEIGEAWRTIHRRALAGEVLRSEQDPLVRADGSTHWVRWEVRPWHDARGEIGGILIFSEDITERQLAAATNARLAAIVESSEDAIISKSLDGTITSWNRGAEAIFDYTREEAVGRPVLMLFPPELRADEDRITSQLERGERVEHFDTVRLRKDGRRVEVSVSVSPVRDETGRVVGGSNITRDITARRQAERALRESEARVQAIIGNMAEGLVVADTAGHLLQWNPAAVRMHGFAPGEDLARALPEFARRFELRTLDGAVVPIERWPIARVIAGEDLRGLELRVRILARGEERVFSYSGSVVQAADGQPLAYVSITDVTERRRAEEALRFHEAILRETGRIAKVGGWTFDVVSGEGVWTEEVARIHDLDPDEPTNRDNGLKYYEPEDRRRLESVLAESIAHGTPYDLELRIRTARGRRKWIRTIGHPVWEGSRVVRLRGSFQDITERKQAERRLATQAAVGRVLAEAATLADAAPRILRTIGESEGWAFGAIWRKDLANERLRSIEVWHAPEAAVAEVERMTRELSFGPGEGLPGQVWARRAPVLIPEVTRAASYPRAAAAEQAGLRGAIAFPIVVDDEVLGVIDFLVRETPEPDPALDAMFEQIGRQIGLFVQRRQAEDEVRRLNQELEQRVQRRTAELEAANHELEAFSYSVSHDLRAPLRAVDGFAQALAEDFGPALPDGGRRYLQLIQGGAQRMGNLIDDLLTLSRLSRQPLTLRRIEPARLVAGIWMDLASERGDRAIEFVVGDLPECRGDPSLLRQVWFNLLSNAVKYTGRQPQARIEVGAEMRAEGPVFFVRDNGAGFDMRYVQKLFGVFQRLHPADEFSGTGVGLAIVQRLVHRHGGRVWAEGAVGQGAAFYFTLETR